jgi:hypothetical protein
MKKVDIKIKEFNMSQVRPDSVCVYVARRNSGKSTLIKDTLFHHQDIPVGTVISPTEEANHFFSDFVPPMFIHYEYSPNVIESVISRQKKIIRTMSDPQFSDLDPRAFLVMDDCLYDKNAWSKDKNIRSIFMNGRHLKLFYLLTMQYPLGIPPDLRLQIDWVFLLKDNNLQNKRRLFDYYAGFFPCYEIFSQVYDELTENYGCMVINNGAKSSRIEDCVFSYRAPLHDSFHLCNGEFWENSVNVNYNSNPNDLSSINFNKYSVQIKKI